MATGPTLPPQAYTREILTSAFNWLQTQPESVKKLATTPDALVGLFMRAQRFGASSMEADAPVSSQVFMSDLKNLAEGLKQFEEPQKNEPPLRRPTPPHATAAESRLAQAQQIAQQMAQAAMSQQVPTGSIAGGGMSGGSMSAGQFMSTNHQSHQAASFMHVSQQNAAPQPQTHAPTHAPAHAQAPAYAAPMQPPVVQHQAQPPSFGQAPTALNDRANQMIHEVKVGLNLSSDAEAINLMVSLAYKHLKNLLV